MKGFLYSETFSACVARLFRLRYWPSRNRWDGYIVVRMHIAEFGDQNPFLW